ncbi:MAG TPA: shikimate kinase [Gemmatimonadales bacterium]|nr:shikimate kinase [Gemmatimonadales bacterium]
MPRHLVLVGLPGCGKSAVGRQVAEGLGAPLFDIDSLLVREMGMPVEQIFGMVGERRFREIEQKAVLAAVAAEEPAVIVPGGGWAAQPGHMHGAREFALLIYLRCLPRTAAKRAEEGEARPLLVGPDPVERMRKLLESREPFYKLADFEVAADGRMEEVSAGVADLARRHAGW